MKRFLSLKIKLIIYTLFFILTSTLTIGFISNNYLQNYFQKNVKEKLHEAFSDISIQLKIIEKGIHDSLYFISENRDIISSLNLIKSYEDKNNYSKSLFDKEKKHIVEMLIRENKYSTSDHTAVYNDKYELIAYIGRDNDLDIVGYVSYNDGKALYFSRYLNEENYHISKKPQHIQANIQYVKDLNPYFIQSRNIIYQVKNNILTLRSNRTIVKNNQNNKNNIVGFVESFKNISEDELNELIDKENIQLTYKVDTQIQNIPLLFSQYKSQELILQSNSEYFIASIALALEDSHLRLSAMMQKDELQNALFQSKKALTISIFLIIILTTMVSLVILNNMVSIPLKRLLKGIETISQGDYSHQIDIRNNDELGLISERFNKMARIIDKREKELDKMAHYDMLTNMPNRVMFLKALEHAIYRAKRNKTKFAVLFLDIDEFKSINDTLGHESGDELLKKVALNLSNALRNNDVVARIGGDEFNILIEDLHSPLVIEEIANKVLKQMKLPVKVGQNLIKVTCSIGIAIFPDDGQDYTTLLKNADMAMYDAKANGKDRYMFFSKELSISLEKRTYMLNALKNALHKNELKLFYQPKFSLKDGSIYSAEALIRWESPSLGFITPDMFIPLAEESGEIVSIGKWVIEQACRDFALWKSLNLGVKQVSVNVSNIQFVQKDILDILQSSIQAADIEPSALEIEITESYVYENSDEALKLLHKIREIGIDIAMDDFGTGYSSMSYLKRLPLSRLKIDKSFIDDIPHGSDDVEITKIIVALAKVMNLSITAEGIENFEQMHFLQELGCDEGQGYICAKPLPVEEFIKLLKSDFRCTTSKEG